MRSSVAGGRLERVPTSPSATGIVAGVDGCRGGWVVARLEVRARSLRFIAWDVVPHLVPLIADSTLAVIAVDMPIGIPTRGPRQADLLARARLRPHGARVFPAPVRAALDHPDDYAAACSASRAIQGKALSRQAWNLIGKIREVDELADDSRIREVHPELCFAAIGGGPIRETKRTAPGRAQRIALLQSTIRDIRADEVPSGDDALDALAAAWTAARILRGQAESLPDNPPADPRGRLQRITV